MYVVICLIQKFYLKKKLISDKITRTKNLKFKVIRKVSIEV